MKRNHSEYLYVVLEEDIDEDGKGNGYTSGVLPIGIYEDLRDVYDVLHEELNAGLPESYWVKVDQLKFDVRNMCKISDHSCWTKVIVMRMRLNDGVRDNKRAGKDKSAK